jgi:hypothetical protein
MPYRKRRWSPTDILGRRASVSYSGGGGAAAAASGGLSAPMSEMPGDDMMPDPGFENTPGYNPESAVYPANQQAPQLQPYGGLLPPVSQGGAGRGTFSMGNSAHGTINLGGILGPRSNSAFNPNNAGSGELPYQTPGFFRRMFGDTGSDLNAAYVQNQNASTLAMRDRDAQLKRQQDFATQRQQAGFDQQWGIEKARLDMEAAKANQSSSTALREKQLQTEAQNARAEADRIAREEERYGPDPIIASMLKRQEAGNRVGLSGIKNLSGGGVAMYDQWSGEPKLFMPEGATPAGFNIGPDGNLQQTPAIPKRLVEFDPNNPSASSVGGPPQQAAPSDPNKLAGDELELLRKAAGVATNAPPAPTGPVEPWYKRLLNNVKPMGYTPFGTQDWWKK